MLNKDFALILPNNEKKLLLLSCCGPCSCDVMQRLKTTDITTHILFYNPNVYPKEEYLRRKDENKKYADKLKMKFIDLDYESEKFINMIKKAGLEYEKEQGKRCDMCFYMRLAKAAEYAYKNNFKIFTSTFGVSRKKDLKQVNMAGKKAASIYPNLIYWDYDFRKNGGENRRIKILKDENMYVQDYCGCIFSKINKLSKK